ncbi:MAG: AzlD domain-containing protein [Eubacteriales bacterium]|nr:AzlD domain-containing protein [Eubacteriales bacterium]
MNNLMINDGKSLMIVAVISLVTILLRFLPFLVFGRSQEIPPFITYLSSVLPYAIIGMLVVYCLKDVQIMTGNHGLPEFISVAVVVALHLWRKNTLLSIAGGTIFYMLIIQFVF